jgi:hypothetical protein|tara:strand:+ start:232 stop:645 length:414 start_codon:yes stop_codon:yes gene_type:complete
MKLLITREMLSKNTALKLMIGVLSIVLVFHFCVLFEIISYKIVWAGKINSLDEMRIFETVSLLINTLLIAILYIKSKNIKNNVSNKVVNAIIWVFVFLFAINTIGNLFAKSMIEQILGTTLTFISSVLCWIIVSKGK